MLIHQHFQQIRLNNNSYKKLKSKRCLLKKQFLQPQNTPFTLSDIEKINVLKNVVFKCTLKIII